MAVYICAYPSEKIIVNFKHRDWLSQVEHYEIILSSIFRKDNNGVQKLNGREQFALCLQQWFIFLIAQRELSFVSVTADFLYLNEDINPGAPEGMEPIYRALYARSDYATTRNRNKYKHPYSLHYYVFQETNLYFTE